MKHSFRFFRFYSLALVLTIALPAFSADVNVMVSSGDNILVKPVTNNRYILLPIQENAENATIDLLVDGVRYDSFTARMSKKRVDYYVPVDLNNFKGKNVVLNCVSPDALFASNYICWDKIKMSDEFDVSNREKFRPDFHFSPSYGWMNDPNGMFYDSSNDLWHLYFQYNPYGSIWGNMTWGHAVSRDLIKWEQFDNAIKPNALGMIFSGSCVIDTANVAGFGKNAVVAFYTSAAKSQMQSMAYSTDGGKTFTPYAGNPILVDKIVDFRDPKVFFNAKRNVWTMVLACAHEIRFYSSANLKEWTKDGSFGVGIGAHGGVWECPDMVELPVEGSKESKWVLIVNLNPGGPFGGSATQYFVGDYDGTQFISNQKSAKWMDYGKDHYATVSFHNAPANRTVVMAWMSNWQYAEILPTLQFRSQNSIPRDLKLYKDAKGEYRLSVLPSKETDKLYGNVLVEKKGVKAADTEISINSDPSIIDLEINASNSKNISIQFIPDDGKFPVTLEYNVDSLEVKFTRPQYEPRPIGPDFPAVCKGLIAPKKGDKAGKLHLIIFIDRLSMEVFDASGRMAMTNLVFPQNGFSKLVVSSDKKSTKLNLKQYSISK